MVIRKHKKQILIAAILLSLGLTNLQAQGALVAAGGNASGSGGSVSYSVGQLVYTTNTGTSGSVAQGMQQAYEITDVTRIDEAIGTKLECKVFPNPATDYLTLSIKDVPTNHDLSRMLYQLYDMNGKLLQSKKITGNQAKINMNGLLPASYFVKVISNSQSIKEFKIIKN